MTPITDVLPQREAKVFLRHNIRYAEQFLALLHTPSGLSAVSEMLGRLPDEVLELAQQVRNKGSDLVGLPNSTEEHSLGMGKRKDFDPFRR